MALFDWRPTISIPAGSFDGVRVEPFQIDESPVSVSDYARFVSETGRDPPGSWRDGAPPEPGMEPVTDVSFEDAEAYASWAGGRLPTAHEWQRAMRGRFGLAQGDRDNAFGVVGVGYVWEWTTTPIETGHVVCGGEYRDRPPTGRGRAENISWESRPSPDVGFRVVVDHGEVGWLDVAGVRILARDVGFEGWYLGILDDEGVDLRVELLPDVIGREAARRAGSSAIRPSGPIFEIDDGHDGPGRGVLAIERPAVLTWNELLPRLRAANGEVPVELAASLALAVLDLKLDAIPDALAPGPQHLGFDLEGRFFLEPDIRIDRRGYPASDALRWLSLPEMFGHAYADEHPKTHRACAMLAELATGAPFVQGDSPFDVFERIRQGLPRLSELAPGFPPELLRAADAVLTIGRDETPSPAELRAALRLYALSDEDRDEATLSLLDGIEPTWRDETRRRIDLMRFEPERTSRYIRVRPLSLEDPLRYREDWADRFDNYT